MDHTDESCSARARCVLWHAPGTAPPPELLEALTRREVAVTTTNSPFRALAEACLYERCVEREEAQAGAGVRPAGVVLLADPDGLDDPGALVRAVGSYAASSLCWVYAPGAGEPLRAVTRHDVQAWSPIVVIDEALDRALSGSGRTGRLVESGSCAAGLRLSASAPRTDECAGEAASAADDERKEPPTPSQSLLTDDELAMLLGDDEPHGGLVG